MVTRVAIRARAREGSTLRYVNGFPTIDDSLELPFVMRRRSDERR